MAKNTQKTNPAPAVVVNNGPSFEDIAKAVPAARDYAFDAHRFDNVTSEATAIAALDTIGIGNVDGRVFNSLAHICYMVGKGSQSNNAPQSTPIIAAFAAKFRGGDTGRKSLTAKSVETQVSTFNTFCELGYLARKYDTLPILQFALVNMGDLAFTSRAARLREMIKHGKPMSEGEMQAVVDAKKADPKLATFTKGLVGRIEGGIADDDYGPMLAKDETIMDAYLALVEQARAFNVMVELATKPASKKKGAGADAMAALNQKLAERRARATAAA